MRSAHVEFLGHGLWNDQAPVDQAVLRLNLWVHNRYLRAEQVESRAAGELSRLRWVEILRSWILQRPTAQEDYSLRYVSLRDTSQSTAPSRNG